MAIPSESVPSLDGVSATDAPALEKPHSIERLAGITAQTVMPPTAAAGVDLARRVLRIVVWTVVLLVSYLVVIDYLSVNNASKAYDQILKQAVYGVEYSDAEGATKAIDTLQHGIDDTSRVMPSDEETEEKALLENLSKYNMLSNDQIADLKKCLPYPTTDRQPLLNSCISILKTVQKSAMSAGQNIEKLRIMIDFSKEIDTHRQNFHAFWLQMAQLILLNLLLPLLTGLFGYIFGTRQEEKMASNASSG